VGVYVVGKGGVVIVVSPTAGAGERVSEADVLAFLAL